MRPTLLIAFLTLLLFSCGSRMQQLETASEKVKQCVSKCSLSTGSVCDEKKNKVSGAEAATGQQSGGGDQTSNGLSNRLKLW